MGIAIHCILEIDIAVNARMEGKSLAMAYSNDSLHDDTPNAENPSSKIIAVDFGGAKPTPPPEQSRHSEPLLSSLTPFLAELSGDQWHDATAGLAAVRSILHRIRAGEKVSLAPDFEFGRDDEDENDLTAGVRYDLEQLEKILTAAEETSIGFRLNFL